MKQSVILLCSLLAGSVCATPPPANEGFRWVVNEAFSDEFDGRSLDLGKWHNKHPYWRGRPPAMFVPSAITISNGLLTIRNQMLPEPQGEFTIACGSVSSRSDQAHYGYYECRMKASSISMSSTFWFSNRSEKEQDGSSSQELDVTECIGGSRNMKFRTRMNSNTHCFVRSKKGEKQDDSTGNSVLLDATVDAKFHVYGAWWVDANTIHFYHDNQYAYTINPSTKTKEKPFYRPMFMNLVTETYDWEPPPSAEDLADDSRNATCYDWVRAYTLQPATNNMGK